MVFGVTRDLFKRWFDFARPTNLLNRRKSQAAKSQEGQFPFNKLEIGLFVQNCFLYLFGDERESNRLDTLLSVAILILLYFFVIQNLFQTKKSLTKQPKSPSSNDSGSLTKSDFSTGSLFMSAIEEIFDIELEKKQQLFEQ